MTLFDQREIWEAVGSGTTESWTGRFLPAKCLSCQSFVLLENIYPCHGCWDQLYGLYEPTDIHRNQSFPHLLATLQGSPRRRQSFCRWSAAPCLGWALFEFRRLGFRFRGILQWTTRQPPRTRCCWYEMLQTAAFWVYAPKLRCDNRVKPPWYNQPTTSLPCAMIVYHDFRMNSTRQKCAAQMANPGLSNPNQHGSAS